MNREFGKYSVAVSYKGNDFLELHFVMDGVETNKLSLVSGVKPSYVQNCSALDDADDLVNVVVFKQVTVGKHHLQIKTSDGGLVKTLEFEMLNKECVFQDTSISLE